MKTEERTEQIAALTEQIDALTTQRSALEAEQAFVPYPAYVRGTLVQNAEEEAALLNPPETETETVPPVNRAKKVKVS